MPKSYVISITGQVQGVGFRPYVFSLANTFKLKGTVSNNESGVEIYVTGNEEDINGFYLYIVKNPPPASKIERHRLDEVELIHFKEFSIIPSASKGTLNLRLTPDFALCAACKEDLNNPKNRRYNYAFTTCINCGPRWAITQKFPFDRENTSLYRFSMCSDCSEEYLDPADRRFHSQTTTCESCAIHLSLWDTQRNRIQEYNPNYFQNIAKLLEEGKIIALKNTSGYLLCCHAENPYVVAKLRELKKRPRKPFAVLYPSLNLLQKELPISQKQLDAFTSPERPIVILPLTGYKGKIALKEVAPGLSQLGVMLPFTGILQLLSQAVNFPIVATSGNSHGSPIISDTEDALEKLSDIADYFVQHDLKIEHPQDDSVLKFSSKHQKTVLFRRSRGYAPNLFATLPRTKQTLLAMGADLKSTLTFLPNAHFYTSQYLGNLENYDVYSRFTKEAKAFLNLFKVVPEVIVTDKHPRYFSASFGKELAGQLKVKEYGIQHHKAHFASVLGEHGLFDSQEKILGVVWDGTGYGDDQQIWGGEFFEYQSGHMERQAHFQYFDWLAGDKMSKEPRLSLLSLCNSEPVLLEKFTDKEISIYKNLQEKNRLKTSSVGRLFDAVASLLGLCDYNSYEGEAAILLENFIDAYDLQQCRTYCSGNFDNFIPTYDIISQIMVDLENGIPKKIIATNFIYTLAKIIMEYAVGKNYKIICCSGGVFQNTTLLDMLTDLNPNDIDLYFNEELPPNDENISFGQTQFYLNCTES